LKKIKLNWQSVAVGMILCAVLVVFIGSKAAEPQVINRADGTRIANVVDVYEKTVTLEAKTAAMDERLVRMDERLISMNERLIRCEKKIDALTQDMEVVLRVLKRLDPLKNK
jgi:hypothetical protein